MRIVSVALGVAVALLMLPALADGTTAPGPQRIKGTIDAFDPIAQTLAVTTRDHKSLSVTLQPNLRVVYNQKRKVADLKVGDFVGAAALKAADGKLHAQQVNVFPDSLRGMGEGQYPVGDAGSNRIMTNATVAEVTTVAANSGTLTLSYRGGAAAPDGACSGHANAAGATGCTGEAQIVVAPGVPVIALMLGDETLLVPGAAVSLIVTMTADGVLEATRLTVEKDGVKPIL